MSASPAASATKPSLIGRATRWSLHKAFVVVKWTVFFTLLFLFAAALPAMMRDSVAFRDGYFLPGLGAYLRDIAGTWHEFLRLTQAVLDATFAGEVAGIGELAFRLAGTAGGICLAVPMSTLWWLEHGHLSSMLYLGLSGLVIWIVWSMIAKKKK